MTGESARIFLFLLGKIDNDNHVPGPSDVAQALRLRQPNVSRSYAALLSDGYLVKDDKGYSIHPYICYRGTDAARETAIKNLGREGKE